MSYVQVRYFSLGPLNFASRKADLHTECRKIYLSEENGNEGHNIIVTVFDSVTAHPSNLISEWTLPAAHSI
jgi:hypothetical protein